MLRRPPAHLSRARVPGLSNQMDTYYTHGTYADCPLLLKRWQTCLRSKLSKPADAEALLDTERQELPRSHVFLFRPGYAQEAMLRYGVSSARAPQEAQSTE